MIGLGSDKNMSGVNSHSGADTSVQSNEKEDPVSTFV